MYNQRKNFDCFDIDTLFFAFYHQQGSYAQYMAAFELKRLGWMFNKKYHTWFRKSDPNDTPSKGSKYYFFDYETSWT